MPIAQIIPAQTDRHTVSLGDSGPAAPLTVQEVLTHVVLIQRIMAAMMNEGEHYGRIPDRGTKPMLLKSGAEKLCLLFRLAPAYDVQERQLERGHREYRVTVTLTSITTRALIGQGVGSCSTLENKYRIRAGSTELTDRAMLRAYRETRQNDPTKAQESIGGKVETDCLTDHFNTVLKMAKKRALVDAVLTTTAASDIFTQDLEEISASIVTMTPVAAPPGMPTRATPTPCTPVARRAAEDHFSLETVDFRQTQIHFGKNKGMTLAELTPQQVHWYEKEWMPGKTGQNRFTPDDHVLIRGLKAYRTWREAEKAQARPGRPVEIVA